MIIVCAVHTVISFFLKVLLDSHVDDFLSKNGHKSLAKKRRFKHKTTHCDIKEIVPRSYMIYNFVIYSTLLFVIMLTIISFFVSMKVNVLFKNIGCLIITAECLFVAINHICEVLLGRNTKLWNKVLLAVTIIVVFVFLCL